MKTRYILEGEVKDRDFELVGRLRYFFKTDNDIIARTLVKVIKDSLEKGFLPYYGSDSISNVKIWKLEELK